MKKSLLFIAVLFVACLQTKAAVNVSETTEPEALINAGYSQAIAEDIFVLKNRAVANTPEPLYEKNQSQNKFVNCMRKFYAYIDPAQDEIDRVHHDIKLSPSYTDL